MSRFDPRTRAFETDSKGNKVPWRVPDSRQDRRDWPEFALIGKQIPVDVYLKEYVPFSLGSEQYCDNAGESCPLKLEPFNNKIVEWYKQEGSGSPTYWNSSVTNSKGWATIPLQVPELTQGSTLSVTAGWTVSQSVSYTMTSAEIRGKTVNNINVQMWRFTKENQMVEVLNNGTLYVNDLYFIIRVTNPTSYFMKILIDTDGKLNAVKGTAFDTYEEDLIIFPGTKDYYFKIESREGSNLDIRHFRKNLQGKNES